MYAQIVKGGFQRESQWKKIDGNGDKSPREHKNMDERCRKNAHMYGSANHKR